MSPAAKFGLRLYQRSALSATIHTQRCTPHAASASCAAWSAGGGSVSPIVFALLWYNKSKVVAWFYHKKALKISLWRGSIDTMEAAACGWRPATNNQPLQTSGRGAAVAEGVHTERWYIDNRRSKEWQWWRGSTADTTYEGCWRPTTNNQPLQMGGRGRR